MTAATPDAAPDATPGASGPLNLAGVSILPTKLLPGMLATAGGEDTYVVLRLDGDTPGSRVRALILGQNDVVDAVVGVQDPEAAGYTGSVSADGVPHLVPLSLRATLNITALGSVAARAALRLFNIPVEWPPKGEGIAPQSELHEAVILQRGGWDITYDADSRNSISSVGLHALGLPELWVNGLNMDASERLLKEAYSWMMTERATAVACGLRPRTDFTDAFLVRPADGFQPFYVVPLDDFLSYTTAPVAYRRSMGHSRVCQVVWPDSMGRFPWESVCSIKHTQRLLCSEPVGFKPLALVKGEWVVRA